MMAVFISSSNDADDANVHNFNNETMMIIDWHRLIFSVISSESSLLQTFWEENVVPIVGENDFYHLIFGLGFGLGYVYHFGFCLVFAIIDWSNRPGFITRYKIQPVAEEDSHLRFKRAIKCLKVALLNQIFVLLPFLIFAWWIRSWRPIPPFRILPSPFTFAYSILFCALCDDIVYYCLHRWLMHNRKAYKHVHKLHHELTAPIASATLYCSPFEHAVNLVTTAMGLLILQSHMAVMFVWYVYSITEANYEHCGYDIPYLFCLFPSSTTHDFHHEKPSHQFYGKYGLMDYVFGTDRQWRQHMTARKKKQAIEATEKRE